MSDPHGTLDVACDAAIEGDSRWKILCDEVSTAVRRDARSLSHVPTDDINRKYPHFSGQPNQIRKAHWYLNSAIWLMQSGRNRTIPGRVQDAERELENMVICVRGLLPEHVDSLEPDSERTAGLTARFSKGKNRIGEAGGSGYSAAFTHPDPLDPNDAQRQRTQSRAGNFPYDSPTSYGGPIGTDLGGATYQRAPDHTPPKPRNRKASDAIPYGEYGTAWEQLESLLDPYSPGDQADDALSLGYGSHGRLGEEDVEVIDLRSMFDPSPDEVDDTASGLLSLLSRDSDGERSTDNSYDDNDWDERVYAPGAEDDPI